MKLLREIKSCTLCQDKLPLEPRPILQFTKSSRILIIGQAPGVKAHDSGKPWNDASGIRLREWTGIESADFYNPKKIAIVPIGFCYPGKGKSGDLPPRPECRARWMDVIFDYLEKVELKILIGTHATNHVLGKGDFTSRILEFAHSKNPVVVLPHPSPRNNIWLAKNSWFEKEVLPLIKKKIADYQ